MVGGMRTMSPPKVLGRYVETVDTMEQALAGVDGAGNTGWDVLAEAPPGHVALRAVVLPALWDSWIHERDIALPLGLEPAVEDDEVAGCLLYAATLGPAFYASTGNTRTGRLTITATDPDVGFVVDSGPTVVARRATDAPVDGPCITGDAVALAEGLSFRAPLEHHLADEHVWLLGGLGDVFEVTRDEFSASETSLQRGS
jgi:hypothetical protein